MLYVTMFFYLIGANGLPFKMKRYNFKRSVKYTSALGSKKSTTHIQNKKYKFLQKTKYKMVYTIENSTFPGCV